MFETLINLEGKEFYQEGNNSSASKTFQTQFKPFLFSNLRSEGQVHSTLSPSVKERDSSSTLSTAASFINRSFKSGSRLENQSLSKSEVSLG